MNKNIGGLAKNTDNAIEILEGWRIVAENYKPSEMPVCDKHLFEREALAQKQANERTFILP